MNKFQEKLTADLANIQNITPIHQQEIIQLEAEIKATEAKYQENFAKANKETDPVKKAKFVALANEALDEVKKLKNRYSQNPIANLGKFDYSNDWKRFIDGNLTNEPPSSDHSSSNSGKTNPTGGQTPWTPWGGGSDPNNPQSQTNQNQLLIFAGIAILALFFLMNQKDHE